MPNRLENVFSRYDLNQDGIITQEELRIVKTRARLLRPFRNTDTTHRGMIGIKDLTAVLIELGLKAEEIDCLLQMMPCFGENVANPAMIGELSYEEFVTWITSFTGNNAPAATRSDSFKWEGDFKVQDQSSAQASVGQNTITKYNDEEHEIAIDHLMDDLFPDGIYNHDRFIDEFKKVNWDNFPKMKMKPEFKEFDCAAAMAGRPNWFKHFSPATIEKVKTACEQVNRWNLMKVMYSSGEDWMTSSLTWTMLTMAVMYDCVDFNVPDLAVLDAGCGTGFMLAAWAVMSPPDAECWGIEIDEEMVLLARREIFQSNDTFVCPVSSEDRAGLLKKIEVVKGDVQLMVAGRNEDAVKDMKAFPPNYFNLITCGVAMAVPERVVECLKEGGVLIIPEDQNNAAVGDMIRTQAVLKIYEKKGGAIVPVRSLEFPDNGDVSVKFVKAKTLGEDGTSTEY